jgi:hypothetical protein
VLSRFTAFLAIDRSEKVNVGGNPRPVLQPVEAPAGWAGKAASHNVTRAGATMGMAAPVYKTPAMAPMAGLGAPAPAQGSGGGGGFFEKAKDMFRGRKAESAASPPAENRPAPPPPAKPSPMKTMMVDARSQREAHVAVDVAPYLRRAKDVAEAIERASERDDRRALDLAVARLAELVEDVRSVGGLDELADGLDAVLQTLRGYLGGATSRADEWRKAAVDLRGIGAPAPRGGGREFWK